MPSHGGDFGNSANARKKIAVVIPCYRVSKHIKNVIDRIGSDVDAIYVVDDKCPEGSGELVLREVRDSRVTVLFHEINQGVGGAVTTGIRAAIANSMDIVVKIDGDGQMDPALLPLFIAPLLDGHADMAKGNRFYNIEDVRQMPAIRLLGNAVLSFFSKFSTGYWNLFDPTNGYIAADTRLLAALPLDKIDKRYFFETDLLFRSGLQKAKVIDIPIPAFYAGEISSLSIRREIPRFFFGHSRNFLKRIFYDYFLRDFNIASLELILGVTLSSFGTLFGLINWGYERPASSGTVMIAALPLLIGIYLLVSFINYDIQQLPREVISPRLKPCAKPATEPGSARI